MRSVLIAVMPTFALACLLAMTGCSSAPKQSKLVNNQYCYTSQTIQSKDKETVTSTTTVKCSDDPVEQYVPAKMGIAKECGEVYVPMNLGGRLVREKVIACKKHDGHYSVIDSATLR